MALDEHASIEDILGGGRRRPGRPRKPAPEPEAEAFDLDVQTAIRGVSLSWLAIAFQMDFRKVRAKLAECPPIRKNAGKPLYSIAQAAPYLVEPKVDVDAYIKNMEADDLPMHLQKEFWQMKLNRQKWERQAGDLWYTADVQEVLGEAFKTMKHTLQLWVDTLERDPEGLSDGQRRTVIRLVDALQGELHQALVGFAAEKSTLSVKDQELAKIESGDVSDT